MGPRLIPFAAGLRSSLHRSRQQIEALQFFRLQQLIKHAYTSVAYYRELFDSVGFKPRHLRKLTDIDAIPVTSRETLQQIPSTKLISHGLAYSRLRKSHTSGSTGIPLEVYKTRQESWLRLLLTLRAFWLNGLRWNDRILTISHAPSTPVRSLGSTLTPYPRRWNISYSEDESILVKRFFEICPTVIYGAASRVAILANLILKQVGDPIPMRLVVSSAESLVSADRISIQTAFGVEPLEVYNCTELGDIGWQCMKRNGFHLNADWIRVDLLQQGEIASPSDSREVVVTSLYRYAMPLIRYSPGDFASVSPDLCECGIELPMLGSIDGRTQTLVPLPDGRYFMGFAQILGQFSEIRRFQVLQTALDHFVVNLVLVSGNSSAVSDRAAEALKSKLGADVRVEAHAVDRSQLIEGPGKFRPVIPIAPTHPNSMQQNHAAGAAGN